MKTAEFELANNALLSVIRDGLAFRIVVRNSFSIKTTDKDLRKTCIGLIGAELRHHLNLSYVVEENFGHLTIEQASPIYLLLSNHISTKSIDEDEMKEWVVSEVSNQGLEISMQNLDEFLAKYHSLKDLLSGVNEGTLEYLSLRFNTPGWVIKMWTKHFGRKTCFKILKANVYPPLNIVRVNTNKIHTDNLLLDVNRFDVTNTKDELIYLDKSSVKTSNEYIKGQITPSSLGIRYIVDKIDFNELDRVVVLQNSVDSYLYNEVLLKMSPTNYCDIALTSPIDYMSYQRRKSTYGYKGEYKVYNLKSSELITAISSKADKVFVYASSSNFNAIRSTPDFFIHFKREQIDECIKSAKEDLINAYDVTAEGGDIIYMVSTLNKKESFLVVEEFLNQHSDVTLTMEEQLYPFSQYDVSLYYAILHKEKAA